MNVVFGESGVFEDDVFEVFEFWKVFEENFLIVRAEKAAGKIEG